MNDVKNERSGNRLGEIAAGIYCVWRSSGAHRDHGRGICTATEMAEPRRVCGPRRSGEFVAGAEFDGDDDLSRLRARRICGTGGGGRVVYFAVGADDGDVR